jgi:hypothetical protein
MDWNKKRMLIELYKKAINRTYSKNIFHDFVLSNIDEFDQQSYEILFCLIDVDTKHISRSRFFFCRLYRKLEHFKYSGFTMRGASLIEEKKSVIRKQLILIKNKKLKNDALQINKQS